MPTITSIKDQNYPLSRALYLYINLEKARKKEVTQFVTFLLDKSESLTAEVGYIPLKTKKRINTKKQNRGLGYYVTRKHEFTYKESQTFQKRRVDGTKK